MTRGAKFWIAVVAATWIAGCANDNGRLTSPSPLAVASPSVPSNCAVPSTPGNLTADVVGSTVTLSWSSVDEASDYVVIVGWTPLSSETVFTNTSESHHSINDLPSGTHYARVYAHNWCGTSDASDPVTFTVQ